MKSEDGRSRLSLLNLVALTGYLAIVGIAFLVHGQVVGSGKTPAQVVEENEPYLPIVTNVTQLVDLFRLAQYPLQWPWQPAHFDAGNMVGVWVDFDAVGKELSPVYSTWSDTRYDTTVFPLWMTFYPKREEVAVGEPWWGAETLHIPVPEDFPTKQVFRDFLRVVCVLTAHNPMSWDELRQDLPEIGQEPQIVMHAWAADVNDAPAYYANVIAEIAEYEAALELAAQAKADMAEEEESGGGMMMLLSGDCETIDDEDYPFVIETVKRLSNAWTEITFTTCTDRVYAVQSGEALLSNTTWQTREAWVGLYEVKTW